MSRQNLRAVTVFPVPTPPVRNAVHWRPSRASGRNSVSRRESCPSLLTRLFGMYAKSRTDPSRMIVDLRSNMSVPAAADESGARDDLYALPLPDVADQVHAQGI